MGRRRTGSVDWGHQPTPLNPDIMIYSAVGINGFQPSRYYPPTGANTYTGGTAPTIAQAAVIVLPVPGTFDNLFVNGDGPTSGSGETFTIYKNGSATALTAHVASGSSTGSDTTHSFHAVAGDNISLSDDAGGAGVLGATAISMRFTPD